MLKVGITGNIGSGKTTVCKLFQILGIPVFNADNEAKWIAENDAIVRTKIKNLLGNDAFDLNNKLNRKWVANKIFKDTLLLQKYNAIIHPAVKDYFETWLLKQKGVPYVLKESAILFESNVHINCDKIIYVAAPPELRMQRVMQRDNIDKNAFMQRAMHQLEDEAKMVKSDYLIYNNNELSLINQVMHIHQGLTQFTRK